MPDAAPDRNARLLSYPDAEIVFGLVYPVGTDSSGVRLTLENYIRRLGYEPNVIHLSEFLPEILEKVRLEKAALNFSDEYTRIDSHMTAGNLLCDAAQDGAFLVSAALAELNRGRKDSEIQGLKEPVPKTAHVLMSLKRPAEVALLKSVYGDGFYLIGVFASEYDRLRYLTNDKNIPPRMALALMTRDQEEEEEFGQKSRKTFELSDVFIQLKGDEYKEQLGRFLDLVFCSPFITPTPDEHAMFLAYSASLRSGQLARQVGAAIRSQGGDIVAVGCNDVPAAGGGLYWPDRSWASDWRPREQKDQRDHIKSYDSNDLEQTTIVKDVLDRLNIGMPLPEALKRLENSRLMDITEYGRAVHAEMDALLTCARNGISPHGSTVFTTTFPCHNCTRHIVAAGIQRVVYVEPYPKSMASKLHRDSMEMPGMHSPRHVASQQTLTMTAASPGHFILFVAR